jgi:hypothetical protein
MFLSWHRHTKRIPVPRPPKQNARRRPLGFYVPLCTERLEDRIAPAATLSLPTSGFSGATNTTVMNFPIGISALSDGAGHVGLASATLAVTYPTGVFNFPTGIGQATADVSLGNIPLSDTAGTGGASDWTLSANSPVDGQLNITLTAKTGDKITTNTFPGGGTLVAINFPILPGVTPGDEAIHVVAVSGTAHTQITGGASGIQTYTLAGLPDSGTITVTAGTQNPPTVPATQSYNTEANTPLTLAGPGLLIGASDPQGEALSVGTVNGSAANVGVPIMLASGATLTVQADGSFVYTPATDFTGVDSFTFQALDTGGSVSDPGSVMIAVAPTLSIVPNKVASGPAGTMIEEDIYLDNPNPPGGVGPLTGFNLALTYDSTALATPDDASGIHPGVALPADLVTNFLATAQAPGVIGIGTYGSGTGADLVTGPAPIELAAIDFVIIGKTTESTPIQLVSTAQSGMVMIGTTVAGAGGTFAINPQIGPEGSAFVPAVDTTVAIQGATPLTLAPATLAAGDFDATYDQTVTASGGDAPYTFAVVSGALPPGLTLDASTGVIAGTATAAGSYPFTIRATDAAGIQGRQPYTVVIMSEVSLATSTLSAWTAGQPGYLQMFVAVGGVAPFSFVVTAGALPPGLTLGSAGLLSGTPTAAGAYAFTVTATDQTSASGSQTYTVTINSAVAITTATLPYAVLGAGYNQTIGATGGTGSLTFSSTGTLPPGLIVSSAGILSGIPTTGGSYTFTITATDAVSASASQSFTIIINPITITTTTLAEWTVNQPAYAQFINATGGVLPLTFSAPGHLPPGLILSSGGLLFGTPTEVGSFSFTVTATDSTSITARQSYVVTINPAVSILTPTLAPWTVGQAGYRQTVAASGGTGPLVFSAIGGVPPGLTMNSVGVLSGTPGMVGSFSFVVTTTDQVGANTIHNYTITINSLLTIATATLANWTVNQAGYAQTIGTMEGTGTVSFTETGVLPSGLSFTTNGVLAGTPTTIGMSTFSVTGTDSTGAISSSRSYTVTVNPTPLLDITNPPAWPINLPGFNYVIAAVGGTGTLTFSASGTLPPGLALSKGGVLLGTPTAIGSYPFTVTVTDSAGTSNAGSITVTIDPAVAPTTLPNWTVNQPGYSQTLSLAGGVAPFTFGVTGTVPAGLTLDTSGVLAGTPTAVGSYSFTVTVTDSLSQTESQSYNVVISPALVITTPTLANWAVGQAGYAQQIVTTGGTGTVTFSFSGSLPVGLTFSSSGKLSGKPTTTGNYTFVVTATDSIGASTSQIYTVVIETPVTISTTSLAQWTVNIAGYSQTLTASGGTGTFTFANTGTLPPGLTLASNGMVSGTPSTVGLYTLVVTATDTPTRRLQARWAGGWRRGRANGRPSHRAVCCGVAPSMTTRPRVAPRTSAPPATSAPSSGKEAPNPSPRQLRHPP